MWDLPGPRIEAVSLALQVGFLTTGPRERPNLHRFNEDQSCPYLLPISLKDSISWWVYPPNTQSWEKVFGHEDWGPGHPVSLSTPVPALRRSLWSEMIPFGDYRTHRRENKGLNKGKDEVRRCPKPRVTRGKRVWWEHRLSWMLIAPSVSVLEAPIDAIDCFFFFLFFHHI